jgi:protein-tyrosine phosphatase
VIQNQDNVPILFHCSAGKDRTGIASALLLSALGVDRKDIFDDYMLTNKALIGKYDYLGQFRANYNFFQNSQV